MLSVDLRYEFKCYDYYYFFYFSFVHFQSLVFYLQVFTPHNVEKINATCRAKKKERRKKHNNKNTRKTLEYSLKTEKKMFFNFGTK